jgi:alpha-D-ribose 1-methylphosphonate 5-triphosphate synthase subunit PhnH
MNTAPLSAGFEDAVRDAQGVFRAVMMAFARPGSIQPLRPALDAPAPLTPGLASVALALADHEVDLWLDSALASSRAASDFLRFHTGARQVADPATAAFALVSDPRTMPGLSAFAQGTDEYPDRSTTLVIAVESLDVGAPLILEGPGIKGTAQLSPSPLPADFVWQLSDNAALFPRGVDCIFVAAAGVAAVPRSARVREA